MKHEITIEEQALKHIKYFQKRDQFITKKIKILLEELSKNPFEGIGKPEPLKFQLAGYWSRRISREHRMVYSVKGKEISVISCRYYY